MEKCGQDLEIQFLLLLHSTIEQVSDVQASGFQALGRLEPSIFWDFELPVGSNRAKFTLVEQLYMYLQEPIWVSSHFEHTYNFLFDFGFPAAGLGKICCIQVDGRTQTRARHITRHTYLEVAVG